jgi:hypothetical protein
METPGVLELEPLAEEAAFTPQPFGDQNPFGDPYWYRTSSTSLYYTKSHHAFRSVITMSCLGEDAKAFATALKTWQYPFLKPYPSLFEGQRPRYRGVRRTCSHVYGQQSPLGRAWRNGGVSHLPPETLIVRHMHNTLCISPLSPP